MERLDVQAHVRQHRKLGPITTNLCCFHDGVDVMRRKWLGMYVQHINLGMGGILPLQACRHTRIDWCPHVSVSELFIWSIAPIMHASVLCGASEGVKPWCTHACVYAGAEHGHELRARAYTRIIHLHTYCKCKCKRNNLQNESN